MIKSISILSGGRTTIALLNFARNLLLAWLVSVEDYGIAATFIVAAAFVETVADLALDRLVVQDPDGGSDRFLAVIHTLMIARGVIVASLLFAIAGPIATLFQHPENTWAYQCFAAFPLVRSFQHLDVIRQQRSMGFGALIKAELAGAIVSLLIMWPLAVWLGDFRVLLVALLVDQFVRCIMTHVMANGAYRLGWDIAIVRRALMFGLPLLAAGIFVFATLQGDRVLVGDVFSARDLGLFSAALTLAMTPSLLFSKIAQTFFLPVLSKEQAKPREFAEQGAICIQSLLLFSCGAIVGFTILGEFVFSIAFGSKMAEGAKYVVPLGLAYSLFLIRSGGMNSVALSLGKSMSVLGMNLVRLVTLPVAYSIALSGGSVLEVTLVTVGGEIAALLLGGALVHFVHGVPLTMRLGRCYILAGGILAAGIGIVMQSAGMLGTPVADPLVLYLCQAGFLGLLALASSDLRQIAVVYFRSKMANVPR